MSDEEKEYQLRPEFQHLETPGAEFELTPPNPDKPRQHKVVVRRAQNRIDTIFTAFTFLWFLKKKGLVEVEDEYALVTEFIEGAETEG